MLRLNSYVSHLQPWSVVTVVIMVNVPFLCTPPFAHVMRVSTIILAVEKEKGSITSKYLFRKTSC